MKVCVVGCERSGTSAVASLLSMASGWSLLDDPPEAWYTYPLVYMTGSGLTLRLWWNLRKHTIVKVPGFATILGYLRRRFVGRFTAIYCVRDPRDVVASILEKLAHGYGPLVTEVRWLHVRAGDEVEALAWRWRKYLESALADQDRGGRVVFMRYEDFCKDKPGSLASLAAEARMPFDADKVRPHMDKQFRKKWDVTVAGPGRWHKDLSSDAVKKIESIAGGLMRRWSYDF